MARKAIIITVKKIIVAPRIMHKNLLDYYRQKEAFYDVKVISKESVMSDYKGKLQDGALLYLIKKYKLLSDNAKALMHFLPYVDESIEDLNPKKLDLIENGYINKNEYLKQFFKDNDYIDKLRSKTDKKIIKAVRIRNKEDIINSKEINSDYLLFDSFTDKMYGGSGVKFDHGLLPENKRDFFLAGGINEDDVKKIVETINPYCIDVSSSVETDGFKDYEKMKKIIKKVKMYSEGEIYE